MKTKTTLPTPVLVILTVTAIVTAGITGAGFRGVYGEGRREGRRRMAPPSAGTMPSKGNSAAVSPGTTRPGPTGSQGQR